MSTVKPFNIWRSLFDSAQEYEKAVRACSLTMINRCHQVRLGFSRTPGTLKYFRVPAYLSCILILFYQFEHHFQTLENRDQALDSHTPASIPKHCNITKFRKVRAPFSFSNAVTNKGRWRGWGQFDNSGCSSLLCAGDLSPDAGQGSAHLFGFTQARREGVPRQFELLRRSVKHRHSDRPGRHGQRKGGFDTRL